MLKTLPRLLALQACDQHIRKTVQTLKSLQSSLAALEDQARASERERQGCHDRIRAARQAREVLVSTLGSLVGATFSTPRITYALALDGRLPAWFGHVHPRFLTPANSIVAYSGVTFLLAPPQRSTGKSSQRR